MAVTRLPSDDRGLRNVRPYLIVLLARLAWRRAAQFGCRPPTVLLWWLYVGL